MRFTKNLFALVSSLAVTSTAPLGAQTPAPAEVTPAANPDEARLRESLRKALEQENTATYGAVNYNVNALPSDPLSWQPVSTNAAGRAVVRLSLQQAVALALQNNLALRVERYNPVLAEYNRRGLYGVYDPIFDVRAQRSQADRESGGFNQATGNEFNSSSTEVDSLEPSLSGYLPTGMRYGISHDISQVDATRNRLLFTNSLGDLVFRSVTDRSYSASAAITATQPLLRNFWIDQERLAIKLGKRDVRISELTFEQRLMEVVTSVEKAYYQLIAARELIRATEADVLVKQQLFEENRRRVEVGKMAPLDEKQAQAQLALSRVTLYDVIGQAAEAEALLKGLLQDDFVSHINTELDLTDRLLALPPSIEIFDAFREAVQKRPDLHALRVALEQREIQLKFTRNQLFPALDLFGTYGANGLDRNLHSALEDVERRNFPNYAYGLSLSFPLTFQRERNQHKAAKAALEQQILAFKLAEEGVIREVDSQIRLVQTTWAQIPLRRESVVFQEAALEAERRKVAAGTSTSFAVLELASDLAQARQDEIGTLRTYNQALADLAFRKGTTLERWRIDLPPRAKELAE
jgi:outer membrane protein